MLQSADRIIIITYNIKKNDDDDDTLFCMAPICWNK